MRECWILLLPGYDDEPVGIEREGGAVETAEELERLLEPDFCLAV